MDQKTEGTNPSRRTKAHRNRMVSMSFGLHKLSFHGHTFSDSNAAPPTGADSGRGYTARDRMLPQPFVVSK